MKYQVKITWDDGSEPPQNSNKYEVTEKIFDKIQTALLVGKDRGNVKEIA